MIIRGSHFSDLNLPTSTEVVSSNLQASTFPKTKARRLIMSLATKSEKHTKDEDSPEIPIPVLPSLTRKDPPTSGLSTVVRDFAYSSDHPLFRGDQDGGKDGERPDSTEYNAYYTRRPLEHPPSDEAEDGFQGAPPWLQSASPSGELVSEEDHASQHVEDELQGRAVALFDFTPEHENEFALTEGQIIYVSSRHGLGWLVAVDLQGGDCGLVPEEYVRLLDENDQESFETDPPAGMMHMEGEQGYNHIHGKSGATEEVTDEWIDEPGPIHDNLHQLAETGEPIPKDTETVVKDTKDLTDEERRRIMDLAEREMALNDMKYSQDM